MQGTARASIQAGIRNPLHYLLITRQHPALFLLYLFLLYKYVDIKIKSQLLLKNSIHSRSKCRKCTVS